MSTDAEVIETVVKERIDKARKLNDEIIDLVRIAYNPSEKLARECKLGKKFVERCRHQKNITKDWNGRAYSAMIKDREQDVQIILGINEVRLDVSAKVSMFVDSVKVGNPLVEQVSFYRIANFFIPMYEWDGATLEGKVKDDWADFVRIHLDDNSEGKDRPKPMTIASLKNLIEAQEKRIADFLASQKPIEADPNDDKARKAQERKDKLARLKAEAAADKERQSAREGFITAVDALEAKSGYATADKARALVAGGVTCGVDLHSVETIDRASAVGFITDLFQAGKVVELKAMQEAIKHALASMVSAMKDAA